MVDISGPDPAISVLDPTVGSTVDGSSVVIVVDDPIDFKIDGPDRPYSIHVPEDAHSVTKTDGTFEVTITLELYKNSDNAPQEATLSVSQWGFREAIDELSDRIHVSEVQLRFVLVDEDVTVHTVQKQFQAEPVPDPSEDDTDDEDTGSQSQGRSVVPQSELPEPKTPRATQTELYAPLATNVSDVPKALTTPNSSENKQRVTSSDAITSVGRLEFRQRYNDPTVDVSSEWEVAENNLLGSQLRRRTEFESQINGILPPSITVSGVITEDQLGAVDTLGRAGQMLVRTDTWSGTAVATSVSTTDRREIDHVYDEWIHDITIEITSVVQDKIIPPLTVPERRLESRPVTQGIIDLDKTNET